MKEQGRNEKGQFLPVRSPKKYPKYLTKEEKKMLETIRKEKIDWSKLIDDFWKSKQFQEELKRFSAENPNKAIGYHLNWDREDGFIDLENNRIGICFFLFEDDKIKDYPYELSIKERK